MCQGPEGVNSPEQPQLGPPPPSLPTGWGAPFKLSPGLLLVLPELRWRNAGLQLSLPVVPADLEPDLRVDFPAWSWTCSISVGLSGVHWAVFDPGCYHQAWFWLVDWLPAWPWICLVVKGFPSPWDSWLNLAAVSGPALLEHLGMGPCPAGNITARSLLFPREQPALAALRHHLPQNVQLLSALRLLCQVDQ